MQHLFYVEEGSIRESMTNNHYRELITDHI